jgi:uncharacterized protein (DUF1778 family)
MRRKPTSRKEQSKAKAVIEAGKERMDFRLDPDHKALIERAAAYRGETVTGYAISTLVREAQQVIREHEVITLSGRDGNTFLELLANPPEPTESLRRAARRHEELISGSD